MVQVWMGALTDTIRLKSLPFPLKSNKDDITSVFVYKWVYRAPVRVHSIREQFRCFGPER